MQNRPPKCRVLPLVCLILCLSSAAARELALQPFSPNPREGFSVELIDSLEPISGVQFDIEYDSSAGAIFPSPGATTRNSVKMLLVRDLDANHKRFLVYGLNASGIGIGSLLEVAVSPRSTKAMAVSLQGVLAVFGNGGAAPINVITPSLNVPMDGSQALMLSGVWNAASGQPSAVSGGTIMTLRGVGIGPTEAILPIGGVGFALGGYRVAFDGIPAALLYAGPDQINVVAPWAITNRAATQITVLRNSTVIAGVSAPVVKAAPEIFTTSMIGIGAAAVRNQDGSVNTPLNPAPQNSIIEIYGTGLGPLNPIGIDGAVAGVSYANFPVSVTIGGLPAEVVYAGSAPSLVSGVFQVNCRVPAGVASGPAMEIRVKVDETRSAAGVTIAIE